MAAFLGVVQGVTEFLPISSSGHLAVFNAGNLETIVVFHLGTLVSILVYYRTDVLSMIRGAFRLIAAAARSRVGRGQLGVYLETDPGARLALFVIVGSIPTGAIGFALRGLAEYTTTPGHVRIVGACFIITGILMYVADRIPLGAKAIGQGSLGDAATIGVFQGIAVMPGLSRSGLTVFGAIWRGFERRDAAKVSFLMAIPAILGASVLKLRQGGGQIGIEPAIIGTAFAFAAGYIAIALLVRILAQKKLHYFAGYLVAMGAFTLIWLK